MHFITSSHGKWQSGKREKTICLGVRVRECDAEIETDRYGGGDGQSRHWRQTKKERIE